MHPYYSFHKARIGHSESMRQSIPPGDDCCITRRASALQMALLYTITAIYSSEHRAVKYTTTYSISATHAHKHHRAGTQIHKHT